MGEITITQTEFLLKELSELRSNIASAIQRIEELEKENSKQIYQEVKPQAEMTEAQAVYTAAMTDTLIGG